MTIFGRLPGLGAVAWCSSISHLQSAADDVRERTSTAVRGAALGTARPIAAGGRILGAVSVMVADAAVARVEDGTPLRRALAKTLVAGAGSAGFIGGAAMGAVISLPLAAQGALEGARDPRQFACSDLARTQSGYDVRRWPNELRALAASPVIRRACGRPS